MNGISVVRPLAPMLLAGLLLAGCDSDDGPSGPGDASHVSILLTDAPGDVARAWVEIEEIRLRSAGDEVVLFPEDPELIELTELVGSTHLLIADAEVETETLTEIRLIIGDGVLESDAGEVYVLGDPELPDGLTGTGQLQCPSCGQSGIKVKIAGGQLDLDDDEESFVLLDFDVAESFGHAAGNSGRWIMHPVIHAVLLEGDDLDGAPDAISGTVTLASEVSIPDCPAGTPRSLEDFVPVATAVDLVDGEGEPIVRAGVVSDADGSFSIGGLDLGAYVLGYRPELDLETATLEFEATVTADPIVLGLEDVDGIQYVITDASCTI